MASMANDCRKLVFTKGPNEGKSPVVNAYLSKFTRNGRTTCSLKAKSIKKDEEIFYSYGKEFIDFN
jgi:hypothetical protein